MKARIASDIKAAMKSGDKAKVGTLRLVNAAIQTAEIESKGTLDDAAVIAVMTKMVKQRRDSIAQYTSGGRADLAAVEQAEIAIIEAYLPKQMDEAAVTAAIADAVKESGDGHSESQIRRADGFPEGQRRSESRVGLNLRPLRPCFSSGPVESVHDAA